MASINNLLGILADAIDTRTRLNEEIDDMRSQLRNHMIANDFEKIKDESVEAQFLPGKKIIVKLGFGRFKIMYAEPYLKIKDLRVTEFEKKLAKRKSV